MRGVELNDYPLIAVGAYDLTPYSGANATDCQGATIPTAHSARDFTLAGLARPDSPRV
jgi:hypothetical protein